MKRCRPAYIVRTTQLFTLFKLEFEVPFRHAYGGTAVQVQLLHEDLQPQGQSQSARAITYRCRKLYFVLKKKSRLLMLEIEIKIIHE